MREFDVCVFIGRFQPFHIGHLTMVRRGLDAAEHLVVVLGSHNRPASVKNPFSSEERERMIRASLTPEESARVSFVSVRDRLYNEAAWLTDILTKVRACAASVHGEAGGVPRVCMVGFRKDASSYYLDHFPQWPVLGNVERADIRSATDIRNELFRHGTAVIEFGVAATLGDTVPAGTTAFLEDFVRTPRFTRLAAEWQYLQDYRARSELKGLPYAVIFTTVDAVVVQSGHVLVVKRADKHGQGLLALPGGFLNAGETIRTGILRELKEETSIKVPPHVLAAALTEVHVFDAPDRSERGRTITHAGFFRLRDETDLPHVKGGSDAREAQWIPIADVHERAGEFFEDHYDIINFFLSRV